MDDSLAGDGDVFVKDTKERVGRFSFRLRRFRRPNSVLGSTDLHVDLEVATAIRLQNAGRALVLSLPDSTFQDFYIEVVQRLPDSVVVRATGGPRETLA